MVWLQAAFLATALSAPGDTVLLDFYADWCGPCRAMEPTINALIEQGCPVRKINIDREPQLAREYGVGPVPCYVMLVDGQVVDRAVGGTTFSRLQRMWELASARQPERVPLLARPAVQPARLDEPGTDRRSVAATPGTTGPPIPIPAVDGTPPLAQALQPPAETRARQEGRTSAPAWTPPSAIGVSPVSQAIHGQDARVTPAALDAALIAASVRLRVEDPQGHSCGSGTIIDARQREALILTCGHIFRDSQGQGRIEVDLFGPNGAAQVVGKLISYDLKRDVALVSIRIPGPVATARVAPPGYQITPGNPVVSVGCNNGDRPTARRSRVNSLDKFLGPPNLQVDGLPVEGRSGGGLFSSDGLVIGVCNAADPSDREGLYAALASIHAELDQARLSFVYRSDAPATAPQPAGSPPAAALAAADPPPLPKQMPRPSDRVAAGGPPLRPTAASVGGDSGRRPSAAAPLGVEEQAALDEIRQRLQAGAEVICVVRSPDPQAQSEIFVLDKASPAFLGQLSAMARPQQPLLSTSLEIPRKPQPATASPRPTSSKTPAGAAPAPRHPLSGNWPASGWPARADAWRPSN
jgi:thiol-disulfide isomerase/thioredoxin